MGHGVASHPKKAIFAAILICIITSLGNLRWYEELDEVELFLSQDSTIRKNSIWVRENFPDDIRFESMIIVADNIIRPDIFQAVSDFHHLIIKSAVVDEYSDLAII